VVLRGAEVPRPARFRSLKKTPAFGERAAGRNKAGAASLRGFRRFDKCKYQDQQLASERGCLGGGEAAAWTYDPDGTASIYPGEALAIGWRLPRGSVEKLDIDAGLIAVQAGLERARERIAASQRRIARGETVLAQSARLISPGPARKEGELVSSDQPGNDQQPSLRQAEARREVAEDRRENAAQQQAVAEGGRRAAEEERVVAEEGRRTAEEFREAAEIARLAAEEARTAAEQARAAQEEVRQASAEVREAREETRQLAEQVRQLTEASRIEAERLRAEADAERAAAHEQRVILEEILRTVRQGTPTKGGNGR
jgi:colicin import membrane protein